MTTFSRRSYTDEIPSVQNSLISHKRETHHGSLTVRLFSLITLFKDAASNATVKDTLIIVRTIVFNYLRENSIG